MPQVRSLDERSPRFTLMGADVTPRGPEWEAARPAERRDYWPLLAQSLYRVKQRELAAGLDFAGQRLKAIKSRTWEERQRKYRFSPGGWFGPPLMPQSELSRTRRLLQIRMVMGNRVVGYWPRWGRILGYHARGEVRGAPVRDVIGVSRRGQREAIATASAVWLRDQTLRRPGPVAPPIVAARPLEIVQRERVRVADLVAKYPQLAEFQPSVPIPPTPVPVATKPSWWGRLVQSVWRLFGR